MEKQEAVSVVAQAEEAKVNPDVSAPNAAQLAAAYKVLRGKDDGSGLTEHPVTGKPCSPAERARVMECLANKVPWDTASA